MSDDLTIPQVEIVRRIAIEVSTAHIDRTLLKIWGTLAGFGLIIVVQLITVVWIGGGKSQMVQDNHDAIAAFSQYEQNTINTSTLLQTQVATINANLANVSQRLSNIENKLDKK